MPKKMTQEEVQKRILDAHNGNIILVGNFNLTARNSPTSKVAGCKGFGLVQGLAPCA